MTGKPAARQGDMTAVGGPIVQGSIGVMIGAPTGVACSVCPGGVTYGSPVNPLLGAKVLPGETDLALSAPLPFVLSRAYSSYRTKTPAPDGLFGPGWKTPCDIHLQLRDNELILNDSGGRSIYFDPLLPGELAFSRTEFFWLARGGVLNLNEIHPLNRLWQALPEAVRLSPHVYLATNSLQGPWWLLGWAERVPSVDEVLPAPLPPYAVLTGLTDRFGRTLTFHRAPSGEFAGAVSGVTDGAGRRFSFGLTTTTSGIRLSDVWLTHDPLYPQNLPAAPLAHYDYSPHGELAAVYDRSGTQVRSFTYDEKIPGRMVAHQYAGRPQTTYRYDSTGRVTEQHNPGGLSYRYQYEKHYTVITDSLNRREVLHTEGEGGMKRVMKKELADGSAIFSEFDNAGRLVAQTDAAGRRTEYRLHPGSGLLAAIVAPDGRLTEFYYNSQRQLVATVYPDGLKSRQEYDSAGRLTASTSRQGNVTRHKYDDPHSAYPSASEDPTGSRRQMVWNRYGQLVIHTDCSGYETRYEYDRFGQLTAVHHEEGLSQFQEYDARGRLATQTDACGHQTRYEYCAAGYLTAVISPDGSRSETGYDVAGNITFVTQGSLIRRMEYDDAGRATTLINENGSRMAFTYDKLDRLTQETGFDGRTKRYHYGLSGLLIRSEDEGLVTDWQYDDADRLLSRTVNGELAEEWRYDTRGWLAEISHLSGGHRAGVNYEYSHEGHLTTVRQTVHCPETSALLWQHTTGYDYRDGLVKRIKHDQLPPVEWLTYGSGYLAGMKFGDTPLIEFTRDRLHRETQRSFGEYDLTTNFSPDGRLLSYYLKQPAFNRDYGWNADGQLMHISGPHNQRDYGYENGRLFSTTYHDYTQWTPTDPAGNRITSIKGFPEIWRDNRIAEDAEHLYHYDAHGRLTEKNERRTHQDGSITHHYVYDNQHRLTQYRKMQNDHLLTESRYAYDPLGRRIRKQVWHGEAYEGGWWVPPEPAESVWYGWDGDRLTTSQTNVTRLQTVYQYGTFTPLMRIETGTSELIKAVRRTLAEKLQQDAGMVFAPELVTMLDDLEQELKHNQISEQNLQWLTQYGLTPERLKTQMEPEYIPVRKIHLYHCDHRGLPIALIDSVGHTVWQAEFDEWGNLLREDNPNNLQQHIRLPGQQFDAETGMYYNRHRYYDPQQGRYITQDPLGLRGNWNLYMYTSNPIQQIDPLGLYNLYQLIYDVWHDDSYGTSSIDITASGDLISLGGHAGIGVAFAKQKSELLSDVCIYATACGHAGVGGGLSAAITYSESRSLPASGVSNSAGVTIGGGLAGHVAYTNVIDIDNPMLSSESLGVGVGVDVSAMALACKVWQECLVN